MIKWPLMGSTLLPSQDRFLTEMSDFLAKNNHASITVRPFEYTLREKEHISFFEAKKKFYKETNHINNATFSEKDSLNISGTVLS